MRHALFAVIALTGCDRSGMDPVDDEDPVVTCDTVVNTTIPADGAVDAYYRGSVEFALSEPDPEATVSATFPGTLEVKDDGAVIAYHPTEPLAPHTTYEATLDYCGGKPTIEFTTSELGESLGDVDLVGRTFRIGLVEARFAGGPGLSEVAAELLARALLVQVTAIDETGVHLRVALADDADTSRQDPCMRTIELPAADFTLSPYFSLQATDVSFGSASVTVDLVALEFAATLSSDASWVGGGTFQAILDARDVAALIETSPEGLCSIAEGLGVPCGECADGEPMCVTIDADGIVGEWLDGVSIEVIDSGSNVVGCE